ncbi:calcium-binding protein [Maliponia aquimaris]|uniref:Hemolysin, plasmid n=1 Tax=Maliponia aquimaris TaxID=1673631 RepID=A0A238K9H2_9RHOB|nr:hypothetical protein [Maliponia aquimaris]SMX39538.1 Hemolysin, plasmid [Maliponia aquimaris]
MAFEVITTNQTVTYNIDNDDTVFLAEGVRIAAVGNGFNALGIANRTSNISLFVLGTVYTEYDGINFYQNIITPDGLTNSRITVGDTGSIYARRNGAILAGGTNNAFANHGTIAADFTGLTILGAGFSVLNTGSITARFEAIIIAQDYTYASLRIVNSGQIATLEPTGSAIYFSFDSYTRADIVNSGQILGRVSLTNQADRYENIGTGVASGQVQGYAGNDTLVGGDLADLIDGGADHDLLIGRAGNDTLTGDTGNDTIIGGAGDDRIDSGSNDDMLNGNAGSDTIFAGDGNDIVVGQDGNDYLDGGADNDTMDGGADDDTLEGGAGNDILRGRGGEDDLAGGLGMDLLTGGPGADNFVFRALAESVVGANRDQVLDFEQGADLIVVAGLSPGVFEFRGTLPFAPSGNPELRLFETATGSTIVQVDADGNGSVDAEIRVADVTGLTAVDFVL